jgi:hypothetical protein
LSLGGREGDLNDQYMAGAVLHAARRFRWIRRTAREGAGQEAMILTRSLVSTALRAAYLTLPEDATERRRRYLQMYLRYIDDMKRLSDEGERHGVGLDGLPDLTPDRDRAMTRTCGDRRRRDALFTAR